MTVRTKINWLATTVVLVLGLVVASCITNAKQRSPSERKQAPLEIVSETIIHLRKPGFLTGQAVQTLDASGVKGGLAKN